MTSTVDPSSSATPTDPPGESLAAGPIDTNDPTHECQIVPHGTVALVGNPNVGKTSVFNRLTRLRAKTSNFPGTTIDRRCGICCLGDHARCQLVDLPGLYSLEASSPEEETTREYLHGTGDQSPDAILIIVDATQLQRSLFIVRQVMQIGLPTVVAVNMIEAARRRGIEVDLDRLSDKIGTTVVGVSARTGEGFDRLRLELARSLETKHSPSHATPLGQASSSPSSLPVLPIAAPPVPEDESNCGTCRLCPYADGHQWAANLVRESTRTQSVLDDETSDRIDRVLTHPVIGPGFFAVVMIAAFAMVFWFAAYPMDLLDAGFGWLAAVAARWLPEGDFQSLVTDGIIGGVGGVVIFLPQICLLFFMLAILEDSGYLARAVVVIDRWMRKVGLPGQAFVPLLAAHACAIPAIMSTKVIENRRDRLAAIMVIPLMTCSARLPVYTMVAALLFPDQAMYAALLFAAAYALGMVTAFVMAWLLKVTILPGKPSPLILDLPPYRAPSLVNALRYAYERGWVFLRDAGGIILMISIVIWALSTYPKMPESYFAEQLQSRGMAIDSLDESQLENLQAAATQEYAIIGRIGKAVAPVMAPLGFDWKTSVGVMTSFAAREVVVSTLSILYGLGPEPEDEMSLKDRLKQARDADGQPVFTTATCLSLLVFFVLAMQCLPTQAVTKKETGTWKWAAFQFGYMTVLAYVAAWVTYNVANAFLPPVA